MIAVIGAARLKARRRGCPLLLAGSRGWEAHRQVRGCLPGPMTYALQAPGVAEIQPHHTDSHRVPGCLPGVRRRRWPRCRAADGARAGIGDGARL